MFCKKCGNVLQEGASFCAKCGTNVAIDTNRPMKDTYIAKLKKVIPENFLTTIQSKYPGQKKKIWGVNISIIIAFSTILLIAGLSALFQRQEERYTIIGEWKSEDLLSMDEYLVSWMVEQGFSRATADAIVSLIGMDTVGEISLTFTESGNIYWGLDGYGIGFDQFTYENLGNNKLRFKMSVWGYDFFYDASYSIKKNEMKIKLFGHEAKFIRVN